MTTRQSCLWSAVVLLACGVGSKAWAAESARPSSGPSAALRPKNVLLLVTDEYRAGCFSFLRHPLARTPNLDHLAKGGVVFDHALCAYPVCTASRGALYSGLWPHTSGVHLNVDPDPHPTAGLPAETVLLATVFHDHGYAKLPPR